MAKLINDELIKVLKLLNYNKLSLSVLKTHHIIFTCRKKCVSDADIEVNICPNRASLGDKISGCSN